MLTPDFSRFVLIPLFVLNMGAMIITLFLKKKSNRNSPEI